VQVCKESKKQSAPHAASCSCPTAAQVNVHHARHRMVATTITAWADAAAVIATKKICEDALLVRPIHVIADQRISLFLCFSRLLALPTFSTTQPAHTSPQRFRDCAVATNRRELPSNDGCVWFAFSLLLVSSLTSAFTAIPAIPAYVSQFRALVC
jgi:hypothetical protein